MGSYILVSGLEEEHAGRVERILTAALAAADPREAVRKAVARNGDRLEVAGQRLDLRQFKRLRVIGAGKASPAMALGLVDVLGERITDGLIITKHIQEDFPAPESLRIFQGSHPVPGEASITSTQALVAMLQDGREDDLIFCVISGGGSALMTLPYEPISLENIQALTRLLLACGADITEMNTLRKHLDQVKGGGLARLAAPACLVTLILSDVIGSPLDVIASGPTVADPGTYEQALSILQKYGIESQTPEPILSHLRRGTRGEVPETLKPGDRVLDRVTNYIVASNPQAAQVALEQARQEGFQTLLLTTFLQGEAAQAGVVMASILRQVAASDQPLRRPACIAAGGETTVTLRGEGMGGRNQEMALGAVPLLHGLPDVALVTLATDGEDGPTDSAGAVVTGESLARARQLSLDPAAFLKNNDSYHFFEALGNLLMPGPTGTNVNDLVFLFAF